jgi:signal transduction histidine kinase
MIYKSLQFKIIFWIAALLVLLLGGSFFITTTLSLRTLNQEFQETTRRQGALLLDAIYNNISSTAERGHMQRLIELTEMVGTVSEVESLLIFDNRTGNILSSINPEEVGKPVEKAHQEVFQANEIKGRMIDADSGKQFCLVRPVRNRPQCYSCHPEEKRILGVLDVCLSMKPVQERIAQNRRIMFTMAILAAVSTIIITSLSISLLLQFMVTRPVGRMMSAINRVEQGDLTAKAEIVSRDELGRMAQNFNAMVETIRKLSEMKDEFISIVSHELRTPLTSIQYFAEVMLERVGKLDSAKQAKYLKVINEETDRLTRLINDLLDLQKISAGKFKWKEEEIHIPQVIQTVLATFTGGAAARNIRICPSVPGNLPTVNGDRDKIIQLLANLLSNAIKFTRVGGRIDITASVGYDMNLISDHENYNRYVLIAVKDEGIGIPREHLHRIFEKFQQVEDSFTRSKGGTGLGLSISKEIVNHHGGLIWVESELNVGSTFFFTLPFKPAGTADSDPAATPKTTTPS